MEKIISKSYSLPKIQATKVWYDIEKNKYYRLDNETGFMKPSKQQGDLLTKFVPEISGNVNYQDRMNYAEKHNEQLFPDRCKSLTFKEQLSYYTPEQDKFFGYQQYYNLRVKPYQNAAVKPKQLIQQLKNTALLNIKNKQCLERAGSGLLHLTGTLKSLREKQSENQIKVLQTKNGIRQQTKFIKPENNLTDTVKIINGRKLRDPNLQRYDHFTTKREEKEEEKKETIRAQQSARIRQRNLFNTFIHQTRFQSKTSLIRTTLFEGRNTEWQNSNLNQNSSLSYPLQTTMQMMNRSQAFSQNPNEMSWTLRDYKRDIQKEENSRKMLADNERIKREKIEIERIKAQRISCKGRFGTLIDDVKVAHQDKRQVQHYLNYIGVNSKDLDNSLKRKLAKAKLTNGIELK